MNKLLRFPTPPKSRKNLFHYQDACAALRSADKICKTMRSLDNGEKDWNSNKGEVVVSDFRPSQALWIDGHDIIHCRGTLKEGQDQVQLDVTLKEDKGRELSIKLQESSKERSCTFVETFWVHPGPFQKSWQQQWVRRVTENRTTGELVTEAPASESVAGLVAPNELLEERSVGPEGPTELDDTTFKLVDRAKDVRIKVKEDMERIKKREQTGSDVSPAKGHVLLPFDSRLDRAADLHYDPETGKPQTFEAGWYGETRVGYSLAPDGTETYIQHCGDREIFWKVVDNPDQSFTVSSYRAIDQEELKQMERKALKRQERQAFMALPWYGKLKHLLGKLEVEPNPDYIK